MCGAREKAGTGDHAGRVGLSRLTGIIFRRLTGIISRDVSEKAGTGARNAREKVGIWVLARELALNFATPCRVVLGMLGIFEMGDWDSWDKR